MAFPIPGVGASGAIRRNPSRQCRFTMTASGCSSEKLPRPHVGDLAPGHDVREATLAAAKVVG